MKVSVTRLEGFSDALIAIIMTLMVLEIQVPQLTTTGELTGFLKDLLLYGASFIVVGSQWTRHHRMLDNIKEVSGNFVWMNLVVLFLLFLVPLFMKWLIHFPSGVIPALGYAVVYLLNDFGMRLLFVTLLRENENMELVREIERRRERLSFTRVFLMVIYLSAFFALSVLLPELSIVCFIILPVVMSLSNLFLPDQQKRRENWKWPRFSQGKRILTASASEPAPETAGRRRPGREGAGDQRPFGDSRRHGAARGWR